MPGAALQSAGQVRNALPFIVRRAYTVTVDMLTTTPVDIPNTELIPFGRTADRSSRAFYVINNVSFVINADDYTTDGDMSGFINLEIAGVPYTLFGYAYTVRAPYVENIQRGLIPEISVMQDQIISIGRITNTQIGLDTGGAGVISMTIRLDIGFYGDYEVDNPHCHECQREVIAARAIPMHECDCKE